jgi:hypothetical protein
MEFLLDILKFTLPSLIVGVIIYVLFKNFFEFQLKIKALEGKQGDRKITVPLRLQAYERLSLFCERISIPNLVMRLRTQESSAQSLRYALLIAIQQEFEHNVSQQVYVSTELWQVIKLSKENMLGIVNEVAQSIAKEANNEVLIDALFQFLTDKQSPTDVALAAIRQEAGELF